MGIVCFEGDPPYELIVSRNGKASHMLETEIMDEHERRLRELSR